MSLAFQVLLPMLVLALTGLALLRWPRAEILLVGQLVGLVGLAGLWQLTADGPLSALSYRPIPGVSIGVRVDRLGLWFAGSGVVTAALGGLVLGVRSRLTGIVVLAQAAALAAVLSGSLLGIAVAWGLVCALLALAAADGPRRSLAPILLAGGEVLLMAGAAAVGVAGGTTAFESVPVATLGTTAVLMLGAAPAFGLLGVSGLLRAIPDIRAATLAVTSVTVPGAVYLLLRLYSLGGGRLPGAAIGPMLVAGAGVVALGCATSGLWAVDFGAFVVRALQTSAALVLAGAGFGGPAGLGGMELGALGLALAAILAMGLLLAGGGRLPSARAGSGAAGAGVRGLALLAVAAVATLPVGPGYASVTLLVRAAAAQAPRMGLVAIPAVLSIPVLVSAALFAGRFGGGGAPGPRRVGVGAVPLLVTAAAGLALPGLLVPALSALTGPVLGLPAAEVESSLRGGTLSLSFAVLALVLLVAVVVVLLARPAARGAWWGSRDLLPPRAAVAPRVIAARLRPRLRVLVAGAAAVVESRPGVVMLAAWTAVGAGAVYVFSR